MAAIVVSWVKIEVIITQAFHWSISLTPSFLPYVKLPDVMLFTGEVNKIAAELLLHMFSLASAALHSVPRCLLLFTSVICPLPFVYTGHRGLSFSGSTGRGNLSIPPLPGVNYHQQKRLLLSAFKGKRFCPDNPALVLLMRGSWTSAYISQCDEMFPFLGLNGTCTST